MFMREVSRIIELSIVASFLFISSLQAQVGIGTNNPTSKLEVVGSGTTSASSALKVGNTSGTIFSVRNDGQVAVSSTSQGFLPPRMTTAQRDAIVNPSLGSVIFNTTTSSINIFKEVPSSSSTSLFGNTDFGSSSTCLSSDGMWFTPNASGTITKIEFYSLASGETASISIKSNSCSSPTLLGRSNDITMSIGWNTWTFATPVPVVANTTYFITSDNASACLGVAWANGNDPSIGKIRRMPSCALEPEDPATRITVANSVLTGSWVALQDDGIINLTSQVNDILPVVNGGTGATAAAAARTNLGASTVGSNLFTLANPSAITFPRLNADNTVSTLSAVDFRTAIGAGTSSTSGTVTSVGLSLPSILSVSGSPVTSSGTLSASLANQNANLVFAGPASGSSAATPTFRTLVAADIPTLNQNTTGTASNVTGIVAVANGGTGTTTGSITGTGALTFAAGGSNQNITLTPSGTGNTIISGGNVGIGTTSPVDRLDIRSAMSVNEIKFRNLDGGDDTDPYRLRRFRNGNNDHELQLHLNDDSQERFAIYGNSCASPGGCGDYSTLLHHYFRADGYAYHAGWLGIGTTSPAAPVHVASSTNQTFSYGYLNSSGSTGFGPSQTVAVSIQADGRIRAPEFNAVSDARIKRDVVNPNAANQLLALNKLNVVNYSYIDKLVNGGRTKTGFIAQQVEAVNPEFVNQSADFVPSVFSMAKTATIENGLLTVFTEKAHGFEKGNEVKLFAEGKKEIIMTIEDINGSNIFTVKGWSAPTKDLFVYGKKVSDFRAIDFDQITALSVGAIQELSKQVDILKAENADLKKNAVQRAEFENLKNELMFLRDAFKQKKN